jgi:hypothetical protein
MGGMTLGKSPEQMLRERKAINAAAVTDPFATDIERASRIGQERGLGPLMAERRLRDAQLRGEMGPPNFTFGEDQEEDERAARRPKFDPKVRNYAKGGKVSSASSRADGCAVKGKTKGKMR